MCLSLGVLCSWVIINIIEKPILFNKQTLLFGLKNGGATTIGVAGEQGFGVGPYPGDPADLIAMGLSPMDGYDDPASDNYGNYIHTNGSVMVFIPAFCYRIGKSTAPSYSRDGANALEIADAKSEGIDGFILHRAFIDGGEIKSGFFFDKYMNSKSSSNSNIAVSVKNGNPISLSSESSYNPSSKMTGCEGYLRDAITLPRERGGAYSCATIFQWSAIAMLSLAHGQAATSSEFCAWYDSGHTTNFPKGQNKSMSDVNDSSVTFTTAYSGYSKTGSGVPFAKTTHNGQNCGVCDLSGNMYQALIGGNAGYVYKESLSVHAITTSNYSTTSNYDSVSGISVGESGSWGNGTIQAFFTESSGYGRALCGVYAKYGATGTGSTGGTALFGNDYHYVATSLSYAVIASASVGHGYGAGVFCRNFDGWTNGGTNYGFRAAGYAS